MVTLGGGLLPPPTGYRGGEGAVLRLQGGLRRALLPTIFLSKTLLGASSLKVAMTTTGALGGRMLRGGGRGFPGEEEAGTASEDVIVIAFVGRVVGVVGVGVGIEVAVTRARGVVGEGGGGGRTGEVPKGYARGGPRGGEGGGETPSRRHSTAASKVTRILFAVG